MGPYDAGHMLSHSSEHRESTAVTHTLSLEADLLLLRSVQIYFCRRRISSSKDVGEISIVGREATPFIPLVGGGEKRQALCLLDVPVVPVKEYCCFYSPACEVQEPILSNHYMFWKLFLKSDRLLMNEKWQTSRQATCIAQFQLPSPVFFSPINYLFLYYHSSMLRDHIITYSEMPISNATADLYKSI